MSIATLAKTEADVKLAIEAIPVNAPPEVIEANLVPLWPKIASLSPTTVDRLISTIADAYGLTRSALRQCIKNAKSSQHKRLRGDYTEVDGPASFGQIVAIFEKHWTKVIDEPLGYDELVCSPTIGTTPIELTDISSARVRIERQFYHETDKGARWLLPAKSDIQDAILYVGKQRKFHPIRDYLHNLEWDGQERISRIGAEILDVDLTDLEQKLVRRWLISAVARACSPGCEVHCALILVNPRHGAGKSSFFKILASKPWFTDESIEIGTRDSVQISGSAWIWEWAELSSMQRAKDLELLKAWMSKPDDRYVAKYDPYVTIKPRSFVVCGTTNRTDILVDDENRRFWVIPTSREINTALLSEWRDQIWAEATSAYCAGEKYWISGKELDELKDQQVQYQELDPWHEQVEHWLEHNRSLEPQCAEVVTIKNILRFLGFPDKDMDRRAMRRAADILRKLGYYKREVKLKGVKYNAWILRDEK